MVSVETISIVFTGLSVSLAAFYYISTLRNAQRSRELTLKAHEQALETRQAQMFMYLYSEFKSREFQEMYRDIALFEFSDLADFYEKYGPEVNPKEYISFYSVASFFEGIGVLVKRGLLEPSFVDDMMSGPTLFIWNKFEPVIKEMQVTTPTSWEWFEYLAGVIGEIVKQEHGEEVHEKSRSAGWASGSRRPSETS